MLILCYGITKSGSTLTFEMVNGMLASAGYPQKRLPDTLVSPGHGVNFLERVNPHVIANLVFAVPDNGRGFLAVKTHAKISRDVFEQLEALQAERRVQVIASYRDPRDICLSLVDAGIRARAKGKIAGFSGCTSLEDAVPRIERQIITFRKWASMQGTLRLSYDLVAFTPDKAIDILERALRIKCDRDEVKKYVFQEAFTQKNKAVKDRHTAELTPAQQEHMAKRFDQFIRRCCETDDDGWFASFRERFLTDEANA